MIVCFVGLPKSEVSFIGIFHSCIADIPYREKKCVDAIDAPTLFL